MIQSVPELVRKMEQDDKAGGTHISKYVQHSLRATLDKIDAYINSKFTTGDTDSMGREKPFFNIVTSAVNIWYRATDLDRKDIRIKASKRSQYAMAFIATMLVQQLLKREAFGTYLNKWGRTLAKYGSAITKFIETSDRLVIRVIPWNAIIVDPIDFHNNPKVEKLWFTPAQLRDNDKYDQQMVEDLITTLSSRETIAGEKKDNKDNYIEIYEVHGKLPLSLITGKESDEKIFADQMHVVTFLAKKDSADGTGFDDFTLYKGREEGCPYDIDHLIEEDDRTLSIGSVEHMFEAQWMTNYTAKEIKDQLALASKIIFQTSDGNFVGQNALGDIETGDILIHKINEPLTKINNDAQDITSLQNYGQQWKALGDEIVGISEAMRGGGQPSGSAWRQTQALLQESHNLFDTMRENKGLAIERMMRERILPYLKKKMDTKEEISEILASSQIRKLDAMYVPNKAIKLTNERFKEKVLSGEDILPGEMEQGMLNNQMAIQNDLNSQGNQRFITPDDIDETTWKEALKDFEWEVDVDVTGESEDLNTVLATLNTALQVVAGLNGQPMSEETKVIFNKILEKTGAMSPLELETGQAQATQTLQPAQPPAQFNQLNQQNGGKT